MFHWKKWIWPGILTVTILSLLTIWMKRDFIQDDLTARATAALTTNGQTWATVEMDGRDAILMGKAPSEEDREQAEKITDETYEVRVVDNQSGLVAAQSPYIFTAKRQARTVELTGFVPNEIVRGTVIDTAKELLPGTEITDSLAIARGQPENLESLAGFGLTQLAGLTEGEISLSDKVLSVRGSAKDRESFDAINGALLGEVPGGGTVGSIEITPPLASPYSWSANFSGELLTLEGFVPSSAFREVIVANAKSALPNVKISDNLLLASGAPKGFDTATEYALAQLSRFKSGTVGLSDLNMTVSGVAGSAEKYTAALEAISPAALPAGTVLAKGDISPAIVSPFTWSVEHDGSNAVLSGFVPNHSTRQTIVEKAKSSLGIASVTDNMQIADGAPSGLTQRADFAFQILHNLSTGNANLSDDLLSVTGVARNVATFENANALVNGTLPSGLSLAETNISPATVSPYDWAAKYDGKKLEFYGFVPDEATQSAIRAAAVKALPGVDIADHVQIAAGAPADFAEAAAFSMNYLKKFSEGSVTLSDLNLSVTGVANTVEDYHDAKQAVSGELSVGVVLALENIMPPTVSPYSWGADNDGNVINLTGFVPGEESRLRILTKIKSEFGSATVIDNMQIAAGAPAAYEMATAAAISILPKFSKGSVALSGTNLTVSGTSKTSAHYLAAERYINNQLPKQIYLAYAEILPPAIQGEYDWKARKAGNHIVLSGHVPDRADRQRLAKAAVTAIPGSSVVNRLTFATGAPQNFNSNITRGFSVLAGLKEGEATISDEQLSVSGIADSVASYEKTLALLQGVGGAIQPPVISPYSWSIKKQADVVLLGGFVPNRGTGNTNVAASAAVLNKPIDDRQQVAAGEPEGFGNAAAALIAGVDRLDSSLASITDTNVFLQGRAKSEDEAAFIADDVEKSLPANYQFRHQLSFPPSKPLPAVKLKLTFVPEPVPDPPKVMLKPTFVPEPVPDPPKVTLKPTFVPDPVPDPPKVTLKPTFIPKPVPDPPKVALKPTFIPKPVLDPPKVALKPVFVPKPIDIPEPVVCTVDFMALIDGEKIQFDTAKAIVHEDSYPLLDRIAGALQQCKNSHIEVGGHTDARGSVRYNQELSEARAQAIVSYLTGKEGVRADKLSAKGYGELQPIAPNTGEERAVNRRIEFKVLDQ